MVSCCGGRASARRFLCSSSKRRYAHEMLALVFDVATIEERFLAPLGMTAHGGLQKWAGENQSGGIKPLLHSESKGDYFFASGGGG